MIFFFFILEKLSKHFEKLYVRFILVYYIQIQYVMIGQ